MNGRVSAYVLAADPWWLENSILSYYDMVDRIIVSYDEDGRSWTGTALPIDDCLERIRRIDREGKCVMAPGHFARLDHHPLDNETFQRQQALTRAGENADWVLQIDTDEALADMATFADCLAEADARGASAMEYPSRWLYNKVGDRIFLELSGRWWGARATFPGPVAVRSDVRLRHCRQTDAPLYRVDFRARNTDPAHPVDATVHRRVSPAEGILHYCWVRDEEYMARKAGWSGHSDTYSEPHRIRAWRWRTRHPGLTAAGAPLRGPESRYRLVRLSAAQSQQMEGRRS